MLKQLVGTFTAEYDVQGLNDPFLQIEILKFFRLMAKGNQHLSDEISDVLT